MKNKELGLPFSENGMEKVAFAFDVDGTLADGDIPYVATHQLLTHLIIQKWKNVDVIVWSGGGASYARQMVVTHFGRAFVEGSKIKFYSKLDYKEVRKKYAKIIAIDDIQDTRLGDVNLIVRNK